MKRILFLDVDGAWAAVQALAQHAKAVTAVGQKRIDGDTHRLFRRQWSAVRDIVGEK